MEKEEKSKYGQIHLTLTQSEIDAIFDCMIGSRSLDGSYSDLVNYFAKYTKGSGFYCSNKNI